MSEYYKDLSNTKYPDEIDEIQHVNDIGADTYGLANQYKTLAASGKIEEANTLLNEHPELAKCGINAGKWNSIADAVMAVERYAKSMKLPIIVSETEPVDLIEGGFWIQQNDYLCIIKQLTTGGYVDIYRNDGFNTTTDSSKIGRVGNVGEGSVSFGRNCEASGVCSQAFGQGTKSTGEGSVSFGVGCTTKGSNAITTGTGNSAAGNNSYVGGTSSTSSDKATNSIVHGYGLTSNYENQAVFGKYNENRSDSLFEVGNGSSANKSNAFSVDKNGNATVKEQLNARSLNVGINGIESLGDINTKNNITAKGQLSVGNGAEINGDTRIYGNTTISGDCELSPEKNFIAYETYKNSYGNDYYVSFKNIKYRKITMGTYNDQTKEYVIPWAEQGGGGYMYIYTYGEKDYLSEKNIIGIVPFICHPLSNWNFYMNYEISPNQNQIILSTNNNQNYDITVVVLYTDK